MLIVTGIIRVPPSDLAEFVAGLQPLAAATRLRDGAIAYQTAVLNSRTGELLVAERWRDQAALTAHLRADDTAAFVAQWQGRLEGNVRIYDASNERPLAAE